MSPCGPGNSGDIDFCHLQSTGISCARWGLLCVQIPAICPCLQILHPDSRHQESGPLHKEKCSTVCSMEWSVRAEFLSGVESDFGVAKVEWSAVVMCATDPSLLQDFIKLGRAHTS